MKKYAQPLGLILILLVLSTTAMAQATLSAPSTTPSTGAAATQSALNSLATLPEAETLIYFNPQRILNQAAPRLMPAKDLAIMRQAFEEIRLNAGIDPSKVEYVVLAVRFRKPAVDLGFNPPEVMAVAGGDFNAESLLTLAKLASGGKLREETYGAKTLNLMTIDPIAKEAEKNPILQSFAELGVVALNATTLALGSPGYLKAAIDAEGGTGRISSESLNSLLRDPNALVSAAGSPWSAFAKSFGMRGTEAAERAARCESQLGDFYVAITMDAANFVLRGSMNADNPDTAKIMKNLLSGLLVHAQSFPEPTAQAALKTLTLTAEDSEVVLRADVPPQMILDFIKTQTAPRKEETAPMKSTTPAKKRAPVRRKRRSS